MKKVLALTVFLIFSVKPTYADLCQDDNGKVTINGIPQPSLINCPMNVEPIYSHTSITVNGNAQSAPTKSPTIIYVVVTATPTPTPTVAADHNYKAVYSAKYLPSPTLSPIASPSATNTPTPTKEPFLKPTAQKLGLFQSIAHLFQNIFHFFKRLIP